MPRARKTLARTVRVEAAQLAADRPHPCHHPNNEDHDQRARRARRAP